MLLFRYGFSCCSGILVRFIGRCCVVLIGRLVCWCRCWGRCCGDVGLCFWDFLWCWRCSWWWLIVICFVVYLVVVLGCFGLEMFYSLGCGWGWFVWFDYCWCLLVRVVYWVWLVFVGLWYWIYGCRLVFWLCSGVGWRWCCVFLGECWCILVLFWYWVCYSGFWVFLGYLVLVLLFVCLFVCWFVLGYWLGCNCVCVIGGSCSVLCYRLLYCVVGIFVWYVWGMIVVIVGYGWFCWE